MNTIDRFEHVMVIRPKYTWRGVLAWPFLHFARVLIHGWNDGALP